MQTAKGTLKLGPFSDIQVAGVSPAEAVLLNNMFEKKGGGLVDLEYTGETKDDPTEKMRQKYGGKTVAALFPGDSPRLPQTFAQAKIKVKGVPNPVGMKE